MASHFPQKRPRALDVHRVQGPGASVIGKGSRQDRRRVDPATWFPARSRAGARWGTAYPLGGRGFSGASGRSAPGGPPTRRGSPFLPRNGEKEGRGQAPWTPTFMAARSHSLVLAWWGAAGRWLGCFVAHVRALIWIRILQEQGLGEKAFRCGGIPPAKASPRGEAVTEGD